MEPQLSLAGQETALTVLSASTALHGGGGTTRVVSLGSSDDSREAPHSPPPGTAEHFDKTVRFYCRAW